jgi:formylglycine-generating enzyme
MKHTAAVSLCLFLAGSLLFIQCTSHSSNSIIVIEDIELVQIHGGDFKMGAEVYDSYAQQDEKPQHTVQLSDFYIGKYEITQKQYETITGETPSDFKYGDNHPVEMISWYEAIQFCNTLSLKSGHTPFYTIVLKQKDSNNICPYDDIKLHVTINETSDGFRLPTEAEWEYACRALSKTIFFWGDKPDGDYAWYFDNYKSPMQTHPVGQKKPNTFGLYDMIGNVREWCYDWYDETYFSFGDSINPIGSKKGSFRVARGASSGLYSMYTRSSARSKEIPNIRKVNLGFRVVLQSKK